MVIQNITGGLGNQMFQYAFIYAQSQNRNTLFKLDTSGFETYSLRNFTLNQYNLKNITASINEIEQLKFKHESTLERLTRKLQHKPRPLASSYYKEPSMKFDPNVFSQNGNIYFDGYWQSERYFDNYRDELLDQFTLKSSIQEKTKKYLEIIFSCSSISLHIRRGDYVTNTKTNSIHGTCDISYYRKAISRVMMNIKQPNFFIFSDDLTWAKDNLSINEPTTFVELDHEFSDCDEMFLMSQCKHNIIANSSFSWWGAWLNTNPKKIVIAPLYWFRDETLKSNDMIPASWIRL
jgi:hypothetical protein